MGQRNINSTNHMTNLEHDQQIQFHLRGTPNYPQPNMNRMLPVAEPMAGFVPHHLLSNCMPQYIHHHPIAGPAIAPNYYSPYVTLTSPPLLDGFGAALKRKSTEEYYGNLQCSDSMAGSSSAGPLRLAPDGGETVLAHNTNHLVQENYPIQGLIPANAPWLDQRFSGNDGGRWAWRQTPAIPYHGNGVNGFTGMSNMVIEHNSDTTANRITTNFQPHPLMYQQGHPQSLHCRWHHFTLPQSMQGPFYPQLAPVDGTSHRPPRNNDSQANVITFQGGLEAGPRNLRPVPPGVEVHHLSHGRTLLPEAVMRHNALPPLNLLPEIAVLEMVNVVDHHRDMRMDVDGMSYEELLALGEHIGNVTAGLSENTISNYLETRIHIAPAIPSELENRETDFCTICQTSYENKEKIGTLDCGHEYHVDCVKKWLIIKNICPICKSSALTTKK